MSNNTVKVPSLRPVLDDSFVLRTEYDFGVSVYDIREDAEIEKIVAVLGTADFLRIEAYSSVHSASAELEVTWYWGVPGEEVRRVVSKIHSTHRLYEGVREWTRSVGLGNATGPFGVKDMTCRHFLSDIGRGIDELSRESGTILAE